MSKGFLNGIVFIGVLAAIIVALFFVKSSYQGQFASDQATSTALDVRIKHFNAFFLASGALAQGYFNYVFDNFERIRDEEGGDDFLSCCDLEAYSKGCITEDGDPIECSSLLAEVECRESNFNARQALLDEFITDQDDSDGSVGQFGVVKDRLNNNDNGCQIIVPDGGEAFEFYQATILGDFNAFVSSPVTVPCRNKTALLDLNQRIAYSSNYMLFKRLHLLAEEGDEGEGTVDMNVGPEFSSSCDEGGIAHGLIMENCECPPTSDGEDVECDGALVSEESTGNPFEVRCKVTCTYKFGSSCHVTVYDSDGFLDKNGRVGVDNKNEAIFDAYAIIGPI